MCLGVLDCVGGAYLRKTVSTSSLFACHLGELGARTIWGGRACLLSPKRGDEQGAHFMWGGL